MVKIELLSVISMLDTGWLLLVFTAWMIYLSFKSDFSVRFT